MLIKAKYDGEPCLLNTDYVVDVFNADKLLTDVYVLDPDRGGYKVEQSEIQRWLKEND